MYEHDELNDKGGYGRTPSEPRKFRGDDIRAAFARAEREHRELARLKASGKPYAALDFHPERLAAEPQDPAATRADLD